MSSPYVIVLSDAEEAALSAMARSGRSAYRDRLRAQIVLAAAAGRPRARIAGQLGVCTDTVRKWRRRLAAEKLSDFKATDADRFLRDVAKVLSKSSLVKIKSTLVRSIRRAQKYDLIGRNVAELVDLPKGQPGHPSRAMTEEQASKVLRAAGGKRQAASGQPTGYVKVVKVSQGQSAATHAATETGDLACGTWTP